METDYWAHRYYEDPKLKEEVEDEDFDLAKVLEEIEHNPNDWDTIISS